MTRRVPWRAVLWVGVGLALIVSSAVLIGWVVGLFALIGLVCAAVVSRRNRRGMPTPEDSPSGWGRWVVIIAMVLGLFGGVFFAARASGDNGTSAAEQALGCAAVASAVVAFSVVRKARRS